MIVPGATKRKPQALSMRRKSQDQENQMLNTLGNKPVSIHSMRPG